MREPIGIGQDVVGIDEGDDVASGGLYAGRLAGLSGLEGVLDNAVDPLLDGYGAS